jgi:hypothetical protein
MNNQNTGGPAFPTKRRVQRAGYLTDEYEPCGGMTLRDYFAAKAMPAVLTELWQQGEHESPIPPLAAKFSYEVADAMLQARNV